MENGDQYIANMRDGAVAGFKYFEFQDTKRIAVTIRGNGEGRILVSIKPDFAWIAADIPVCINGFEESFEVDCDIPEGVHPVYFRYIGVGYVNFVAFALG